MLIESLQDASLYKHDVEEFQVLETHISWVLLTGPYAYKLKKPVDMGFVNFSTLELREQYCHDEIRLNRRLAPDLYLGVLPITGTPESPQLDGEGEVIDYAVQMAQFTQESLLSRAITEDRLTSQHINQLAEEVAEFHTRVEVAGMDRHYGNPEKVMAPVIENFRHLEELFAGDEDVCAMVASIREANELWHQAASGLLAERKARGFIRECHGDMHLGNMILSDDGVTIFDCLEFNADLRWVDVMSEVAFVVMDLEDRGHHDYAMQFLNRYLELIGDYAGVPLLRFYLSYRAMVRAKVAALRLDQHTASDEESAHIQEEFWSYLKLARKYVTRNDPLLIVTHGVSGSGKSHGSGLLLEGMEAIRIRSDVERKRLQAEREIPEDRLYSSEVTELTYKHLLELAETILNAGWTVIVDATTLKKWQRSIFQKLAERMSVRFRLLCFEAEQSVLEERINERQAVESEPSDATLEVLQLQLAEREPLTTEEQAVSVALSAEQEWTTEMLVQLVADSGNKPD